MKKRFAPYLRWLKYILMILVVITFVEGLYDTFRYSKIYQNTPQEIAAHLDSGDHWGMRIETTKDEINARVQILNGCSQIGTLDLQNDAILSISGKRRIGEAKLMLLDGANQVVYFEALSPETDTVAISSGSYQAVVVGHWYSGSTSIEILQAPEAPDAAPYAPLATGGYDMLALKADGSLLSWGDNMYGTLGGADSPYVPVEDAYHVMDHVAYAAGCMWASYAVDTDHRLWGWGTNQYGLLLGEGRKNPALLIEDVVMVSADYRHCLAVKEDGTLWWWGWNGAPENEPRFQEEPEKILDDAAYAVAAADSYDYAITGDGRLLGWNSSSYHNAAVNPVEILDDVISVAAWGAEGRAIRFDGTLWAWQVIDGTVTEPQKAMENVSFCGFGVMVTGGGSLWTWEENSMGELGDGTLTRRDERNPVRVLEHVCYAVRTGESTLAVTEDGALWRMGRDAPPTKIMDGLAVPA